MDFLAMDKVFVPNKKIFVFDNLGFVLDKKYFVRAEGRGIKLNFLQNFKEKKTRQIVWTFL